MDGRGRSADGGRDGRERHGGRHGSSLPGSAVKYLGRARYCGGAPRQFIGYREIFYLPPFHTRLVSLREVSRSVFFYEEICSYVDQAAEGPQI